MRMSVGKCVVVMAVPVRGRKTSAGYCLDFERKGIRIAKVQNLAGGTADGGSTKSVRHADHPGSRVAFDPRLMRRGDLDRSAAAALLNLARQGRKLRRAGVPTYRSH